MLAETHSWTPYIIISALTLSMFSIFMWSRRKKYERVGKISKLYFYPVKSLKAVEVSKGKCTKLGFEVNGLLDRSFMIVNENGRLVTQEEAPSLALLAASVEENCLIIISPSSEVLSMHGDEVTGVDCGNEAASWFESYTKIKEVRLVRFFPAVTIRKTVKKNEFFKKLRKRNPAGFQGDAAFHILSQSSIDDLNSRIGDTKMSALNFRPNILIEDCASYAEDSWKYIKINDEAELERLFFTARCLTTTNDPESGNLSNKEPLVTLRKYRILDRDSEWFKRLGSSPCLGITCGTISTGGEIKVGDDIFAVLDEVPKMREKTA